MQLTRLAITRHLATIAMFVALAIVGVASYAALPINEFPQVNIPVVTVTTTYADANPQAIETQITRPVEDAVASLNNIDTITSTSGEGFSTVTITFTDQADSKQISAEVERQLNTVVATLPTGADRPVVLKIDLSQIPIMELALVDDSQAPEQLYATAHDQILPNLEQLSGVSQVALIGGRQEEVKVAVDPTRLAAYGVTLSQIQSALAGREYAATRRQRVPGSAAVRPASERAIQQSRGPGQWHGDVGDGTDWKSAAADSSGLPTRVTTGITSLLHRRPRRAPIALPAAVDDLSTHRQRSRPTGTEGP